MQTSWKYQEYDSELVARLEERTGMHSLLCQLLVQRGITEPEDIHRFFHPSLTHLHQPFLMKDMDKAVTRLLMAAENGERVLLYGDYDVDGITSVAFFYAFLKPHIQHLDYYIPDRYKEGYGLSSTGISYASRTTASLIVSLDCGIKGIEPIREAKEAGIDVIICDHHLPGEELPDAYAILDPLQEDCPYPYKSLSGCGIAFKFAQALTDYAEWPDEDLWNLLDLVTVSIACDLVPMTGENRTLAYFGMQQLNHSARPGLRALVHESTTSFPVTTSDIIYYVGPMINAVGRLSDAREAVRLLLTEDKFVAQDYARHLQRRNEERKRLDREVLEEAIAQVEAMPNLDDRKALVLFKKEWHQGLIGITASRIAEQYHRPTVVLCEGDEELVGSARTVNHFDLYEALNTCEPFLNSYGGHAHAAGMTMSEEKVEPFRNAFEQFVAEHIQPEQLNRVIRLSGELRLNELTDEFFHQLQLFAPFGPENPNPVFASYGVYDTGQSRQLKDDHLRLHLQQADSQPFFAIAFRQGRHWEQFQKHPADICYSLSKNRWKGKSYIQLRIKDMKFSGILEQVETKTAHDTSSL